MRRNRFTNTKISELGQGLGEDISTSGGEIGSLVQKYLNYGGKKSVCEKNVCLLRDEIVDLV